MQSEGGESNKRRKRATDWREGPAFLDATSSVSVSTFGARRLPELKNLYFQVRRDENVGDDSIIHERKNLLSGGGKRSSRHLRRRTTAIHSKRHRHRYPASAKTLDFKGKTRKSRRKKSHFLESEHLQWLNPKNRTTDGENDYQDQSPDTSSSNKLWQVTHRWHAKRFHLLSPTSIPESRGDPVLGGWTGIPLVHSNRGPRAAVRLSQNKDKSSESSSVMIRDMTWECQPLVLMVAHSGDKPKAKQNEQAQFLLQQLGRLSPGILLPAGGNEALHEFLSDCLSIEETSYQLDAFPSRAIGPVVWRMETINDEKSVVIRCHPSIRTRIQQSLEQLASSIPSSSSFQLQTKTNFKNFPKICFRLYGDNSLNALNSVLNLYQGELSDFLKAHQTHHSNPGDIRNGSIIRIKSVELARHTTGSITDSVLLVYRAPRALDCPANCAIAGWEVHCSNAAFAKELWLALVTLDGSPSSSSSSFTSLSIRGCCAIGLIEENHMRLECEPPILLFPRDYVDTEESKKYWTSSSSSWKRIRQLSEGGWGRLPIDKEKRLDDLEAIHFSKLVTPDETGSDTEDGGEQENDKSRSSTVTVRGSFCRPFVVAIGALCANNISKEETEENSSVQDSGITNPVTKKRRRNRRPSRPKNQVIRASPLPKASKSSLGEYCDSLSSSLSLPAVLMVHVRALGQGRISPGMAIVWAGNEEKDHMLGRITAGGFSTCRGVVHGIGAVGVAHFLEYVRRTTNENGDEDENARNSITSYGRIVRLANGSQSAQLLARVLNMEKDGGFKSSGFEATLSALI